MAMRQFNLFVRELWRLWKFITGEIRPPVNLPESLGDAKIICRILVYPHFEETISSMCCNMYWGWRIFVVLNRIAKFYIHPIRLLT